MIPITPRIFMKGPREHCIIQYSRSLVAVTVTYSIEYHPTFQHKSAQSSTPTPPSASSLHLRSHLDKISRIYPRITQISPTKQSCPTPVAAPQELSAIPAVVLPEWVTTLAAGRLEWATTRAAALLGWATILAGRRGTRSE